MRHPLAVLIGCDCDPDRPRYGGSRYDSQKQHHKWNGITDGIGILLEILHRIERAFNVKPKIIFCIRSDQQMKEIYGTAAWMLEEFHPLWQEIRSQGHEIAWHPHLWRWSEKSKCWRQEVEDKDWIAQCLEIGHADFLQKWGGKPFTCHTGWTFHNNTSMQTISRLGVRMDFSASPGVYFEGGPGAGGTVFDNRIDWRGTPQRWYHPSIIDYRRPPEGDESRLNIMEIPKFTSTAAVLRAAKGMAYRLKKGAGAAAASAVFLQITLLPLLYQRNIRERLANEQAEPFFATFFHPDELLEQKRASSGGFLYSAAHMEKNLGNIIKQVRKRGREVIFATGPEAVDLLKSLS